MASFTTIADFLFKHVSQADRPSFTAAEWKTYLDSQPKHIRDWILAFLAEIAATTDGSSGADKIGMTAITETGANVTVQSVFEALITRLKAVTDSASGADLIGATAISSLGAAATVQAILEALAPMTTQGDIVYQGASAPARLAKGTAGQFLKQGTAIPEWGEATSFKVGSFTRDTATATGTQAITGVGFTPKAVIFFAAIPAVAGKMSVGFDTQTAAGCVFDMHTQIANAYSVDNYSIVAYTDGLTDYHGLIQSMDADGFTINWTKVGTTTGTLTVKYLAMR